MKIKSNKYIATITVMSAHKEYEDIAKHPATPVVKLRQVYPTTPPKDNEFVIHATSRVSAWAKAKRIAGKIGRLNMNLHKDQPIDIIQVV